MLWQVVLSPSELLTDKISKSALSSRILLFAGKVNSWNSCIILKSHVFWTIFILKINIPTLHSHNTTMITPITMKAIPTSEVFPVILVATMAAVSTTCWPSSIVRVRSWGTLSLRARMGALRRPMSPTSGNILLLRCLRIYTFQISLLTKILYFKFLFF